MKLGMVVVMVVAMLACSKRATPKHAGEDKPVGNTKRDEVAGYKTYVGEVCACEDRGEQAVACTRAATARYGRDYPPGDEDAATAAAFAKAVAQEMKRLGECTRTIAGRAGGRKVIDDTIAGYRAFVDATCDCLGAGNPAQCARAVTDNYIKANAPSDDDRFSAEDAAMFARATADSTKKFSECVTKIGTAAATP